MQSFRSGNASDIRPSTTYCSKFVVNTSTILVCVVPWRWFSSPAGETAGSAARRARAQMPVKHIVMWNVTSEATEAQLSEMKARLLALRETIPTITSCEYGVDLQLPSGQSHPGGKNRSVCFSATFATTADYEAYAIHADHVAVITECIKPNMVPGTRAAVQYEV